MNCNYCSKPCIRKGMRNHTQQYYCTSCCKYQRKNYQRKPIDPTQKEMLIQLNNEGLGIRSIGRILSIAASSVIKHAIDIAANLKPNPGNTHDGAFEIDEMQTYIGRNIPANYIWITYALHRETRVVVDFSVGRRTKETLGKVVSHVLELHPNYVYTDRLNIYRSLIDKAIHRTQQYKINHIERKNLTLRTHLKGLNRGTICFSRSMAMLVACLQIYFFS